MGLAAVSDNEPGVASSGSDRRGGSVRSGLVAAGEEARACITWQLGGTRRKGPPES
jgi:hypothetical protein